MRVERVGIVSVYLSDKDNEMKKIKNEKRKNLQNVEREYQLEISLNYQPEDKDYQVRLEKIVNAIKNGTYSIDLDKLARSLIKETLGE